MCSVEARYSGLKPLIHDCASAGSLGKIVVSETIFSIGSAPKTEGDHTDAGLTPIFGEQYDRLLEDVFALQDEITMCVVGAIEPSLRKAELDRVKRQRPNTFSAYDLLLRSQQFVFAGMPKEVAQAIPLLEDALKLEPDYSVAHAYLSWRYHSRFGRGGLREEDRLAAIHHARSAVALGNDDAQALAIAALVLAYDGHEITTALKVFDRALEISNSNIFVLCWNAAILCVYRKPYPR